MGSRIIIFDDNQERLNSVAMLLNLSSAFTCTGRFGNANNLLADIAASRPDLILMDIDMPGVNGIEATKMIRTHFDALPVIMQTNFEDDERIFDSLRAGANGYLLKKTSPERFLESLKEAFDGGAPMTGSIATRAQFADRTILIRPRKCIDARLACEGYVPGGTLAESGGGQQPRDLTTHQ